MDKLQDLIAEVFSRGSSMKDGVEVKSKLNLEYVNQTEIMWAFVEYDPVEQRFGVVPITKGESSTESKVEKDETANLKVENKEKTEKEEIGSEAKA